MKWDLIEACIARGLDDGVEDVVNQLKLMYDNTTDEKLKNTLTQSIYFIVDAHLITTSQVIANAIDKIEEEE
jgi:hypothetical protein